MANTSLESEFRYYLAHQSELVGKYDGKFVVIKGSEVIGDYDTIEAAFLETSKTEQPGTFLIQRCSAGDADYSQTYRSRVCFAS